LLDGLLTGGAPMNDKGQGGADCQADHGPDPSQQQHLREINDEDTGAGRAQGLHRGDGVALAVEMALHRIGDADPAHQQRGQADQREILRERSTLRSSCGDALLRVRTSHPASGSCFSAAAVNAAAAALSLALCPGAVGDNASARDCRAAADRSRATPRD